MFTAVKYFIINKRKLKYIKLKSGDVVFIFNKFKALDFHIMK